MIRIRFRKKAPKGQALVEYATIIALVSLISLVILSGVGLAISRNYAVIASVFGGKKNPGSSVSGLTNTISIETTSPQVTCHVVHAGNSFCSSLPTGLSCGSTGITYVQLQLYASPDIQQQDLAFSVNNLYAPSATSGSAAVVLAAVQVANGASTEACGNGIVVTGKKAITIVPIQAVNTDS